MQKPVVCIACNQPFPNIHALAVHKKNNCPEWEKYIEKITNDPSVKESIQRIGFDKTGALVQINAEKLHKMFTDIIPKRSYNHRVAKPVITVVPQ